MRIPSIVLGAATLFVTLSGQVNAEERHQDHEQLRSMLKTATASLNARDFAALAPLLRKQFSVVTMDQKRLTTLSEVKSYFDGFFTGDKPLLKKVTFNPSADDLTDFLDADAGVCHGSSMDTYDFTDGDTRTMPSRWSAVVTKEKGKWKLASLHIGVNLSDNPILTALKDSLYKAAGAGLLIGLVLGALGAKFLSRAKA